MRTMATPRDPGAFYDSVFALAPFTATAGGAGDNVEQNGDTIQRTLLADLFLGAVVEVLLESTLTASETSTVTVKMQDSADGSAWADYTYDPTGENAALPDTVLIQSATGSNKAVVRHKVDLSGARDFIRVVVKAEFSLGATDTAEFAAIIILGGGNNEIATA